VTGKNKIIINTTQTGVFRAMCFEIGRDVQTTYTRDWTSSHRVWSSVTVVNRVVSRQ